ncbi:PAS domain S-box protein [Candidatus Sumerlaeota bacterium]|nr:PAS domain S-box protein [Candidatus Sumerlaeota bacterium]
MSSSEANLSALLDEIDEWIWSVDREHRLIGANAPFLRHLREITGKTLKPGDSLLLRQWPKRVREQWRALYDRALGGECLSFETETLFSADSRTAECRLCPIRGPGGSARGVTAIAREITERGQAEQAQRLSEEHLRTLADASFEAICLSEGGICVGQNRAAEQLFGRPDRETIGRPVTEWVVPEDRDTVRAHIEGGSEEPLRVTALRSDGTTFPCEIQARVMNLRGRRIRVTALRDITPHWEIEQALRESEERHQMALAGGELGTWDWDVRSGEVRYNERWAGMLGYEIGDLYSRRITWEGLLHPDDRAWVMESFTAHLEGKTPHCETEHRLRHRSGKWVWVLDRGKVLVRDVDGRPLRVCGTHLDITERKEIEAKVAEREALFHQITANASVATYRLHWGDSPGQGTYEFFGHDVESLVGVPAEELNQQRFLELIEEMHILDPEMPAEITERRRAFTDGGIKRYRADIRIRTPRGEIKWLNDCSLPLRDETTGKVIGSIGILQDITQRRRAEEERDALTRLTRRLSGPLTESEVGQIVAEESRRLFQHDAFAFSILDARGERLRWIHSEDTPLGQSIPEETVIPSDEFPLERSPVAGGEAVLINRDTDPQDNPLKPFGDTDRLSRSLMLAPLLWKGQVMGVLSAQSYTPARYGEREFALFQAFAAEVGGVMARLREEEALEESEGRLRSIFRAAPAGIGVVQSRILVNVNDRICEMVGRSREELLNQSSRILYPTDEDYELVGREKYSQIRCRGTETIETRWLHRDGRTLDVILSSTPIDPDDLAKGVTFTAIDITERKQIEVERETLRRLTQSLAGPITLEQAGATVAQESRRLFSHDAFAFAVLDHSGKFLLPIRNEDIPEGATEPREMVVIGRDYPLDRSPIRDGKPKLINRPEDMEPGPLRSFGAINRQSQSIMSAPLLWEGQVMGVLSVQSYTPHRYRQRDFDLFQSFADQVSVVMARLRTEMALSQSKARLQRAQRVAHIGDWEWGVDTGETNWSDEVYRIFGYEPSEVVPSPELIRTLTHPADFDLWRDTLREALQSRSGFALDYHCIRRDGEVIWIHNEADVTLDENGQVTTVYGTVQDITERKRIEEALRLHSEVYHSMAEPVIVSTREGITVDVNPMAERLFGWTRREIVGRGAAILNPPGEGERITKEILEALGKVGRWEGEIPLVTRTGENLVLATTVTRLSNERGEWVGNVGISRDITDRKRTEQALAEQNRRLSVLNEVANATTGSLSPAELCDRLLDIVREALPCDAFLVISHSEETQEAHVIASHDILEGKLTHVEAQDVPIEVGKPLHRTVVVDRRPLLIHRENPQEESRDHVPFGEVSRPSASLLYAPLVVGDRLVGIMSVQSYSPHAYSPLDVELFEAIARQTGPALEAALLDEQLRESKHILDETGRLARIGGWEHDLETGKAVWTRALCEIMEIGSGPPPSVDEHLNHCHPEHRPILAQAQRRAVEEGVPFDLELQAHTAKGNLLWCRISGEPVFRSGKCVKLRGTFQDITVRKLAELALEEQNERLSILNAVAQATTGSLTPSELSERLMEIVRRAMPCDAFVVDSYSEDTDQSLVISCFDTIGGEMRRIELEPTPVDWAGPLHTRLIVERQAVLLHRENPEKEGRAFAHFGDASRSSSSLIWVPLVVGDRVVGLLSAQSYLPNAYSEENRDLLMAIARQVAPTLEATLLDERLRESERRYRTLFERAPVGIFTTTSEGEAIDVNPAMAAILGIASAQEALRRHTDLGAQIYLNPKRRGEFLQLLRETGRVEGFDYEARTMDGQAIWLSMSARLAEQREDGTFIIEGFTTDITERKRLETQLRQAQKMEAIGQLAGGVAHDFNNLLLAIRGNVELVLEQLPEKDPNREDLEEVIKAADRAAVLTRQLLAFSRQQMLRMVSLDLNDLIANLIKMLRRLIRESIDLGFEPGPNLPAIHADPGQIEQVLMNLCVNASDAMPEGGRLSIATRAVTVDPESPLGEAMERGGECVLLRVEDTGCGIEEGDLSHIFEPFFTTKEVGRGTGLGLATVFGIVKQHGGQIDVHSTVGQGARFDIHFPVEESELEFPGGEESTAVYGGSETILMAEDDPMVRNLTVRTLERAGYKVIATCDGEEALQIFEEFADEIDLVLLDVIMPKMSGRAAHARMRVIDPQMRVLFVSGYDPSATHAEAFEREGLELLAKPFNPPDLLSKIRAILDS